MGTEPRTPPYGDRKQSADPVDPGGTEVAGADVGGARQHRTSDPASAEPTDGAGTGPAHTPGVARGEDRSG